MSEMVYVVMGSSGEYSDRSEWPVRAYLTRTAAEAEVLRLSDASRVLEEQYRAFDRTDWEAAYKHEEALCLAFRAAHDPSYQRDYTGTRYFMYDVPLIADPPSPEAA